MKWALGLAAAAAIGLAGSASAAEPATVAEDLNCALVGFVMASSDGADEKQAGLMLAFYYYGALSRSGVDVERRLRLVAEDMTETEFAREVSRCTGELEKIGASMERFGKSVETP